MLKIVLDVESFYSKEYSLRKMTPIEYILGEQWETIGWGVKVIREGVAKPTAWLEGDKVAELLRKVNEPWMAITHNALFDCCVLAYRYKIYPTISVDTMSMARALLSPLLPRASVSLGNVADYLGVGVKNSQLLGNVMGMRLADIKARPDTHYEPFKEYCRNDCEMTWAIYEHLSPKFPATEFAINDMVIRMATQPQFGINLEKLYAHREKILAAKNSLLDRAGVSKLELMSNDKFALALRRFGVEPPLKLSPTTGQQTWAFAKTDEGMEELQEHPDPDVQALVAARLGAKSTLEETRTQRFINIAGATFDGNNSYMPIPLKFSGAHTHRFSGDWKLNLQNLPSRKDTDLRESLQAVDAMCILAVDASQIEARLTAWLCRALGLVQAFANGDDIYSLFASALYGYLVAKKTHKTERFLGKTSILGLGFGMGPPKFENTVRVQAADAGIEIDLAAVGGAAAVVQLYRRKYPEIKANGWDFLDGMIQRMYAGNAEGVTFGPCVFGNDCIRLPSGLDLFYKDLQYDPKTGKWSYWNGRKRKGIWGGTMLENIVQALDRVVVMEAALRIAKRVRVELGYVLRLAHQVHDELVYVVPLALVAAIRAICDEEMGRRPKWGLDLPLASESKVGPNYGQMHE